VKTGLEEDQLFLTHCIVRRLLGKVSTTALPAVEAVLEFGRQLSAGSAAGFPVPVHARFPPRCQARRRDLCATPAAVATENSEQSIGFTSLRFQPRKETDAIERFPPLPITTLI